MRQQALTGNATVTFGYASSCNNSMEILVYRRHVHHRPGNHDFMERTETLVTPVVTDGPESRFFSIKAASWPDVAGGGIYRGAPGGFTNTGSILVESNCAVYLGGVFNAASLGTYQQQRGHGGHIRIL